MMGMNPKKMEKMMRKMGINQVELKATRVIIELADKRLIFDDPNVTKVNMMGKDNFQVVGEVREEAIDSTPEITQEDIETVASQANVDNETAKKAIEDNDYDIAKAILSFSEE